MKLCFFCTNEIKDESKMKSIYSYCVCEKCSSEMEKGTTLVVTDKKPSIENQAPICKTINDDTGEVISELYPTGEWLTLPDNAIEELFGTDAAPTIIKNKFTLISSEVMQKIKHVYETMRIKTDKDN